VDENFEETVTCFLIVSVLYTHSPTCAIINVTEGLCHVELSIYIVNYVYVCVCVCVCVYIYIYIYIHTHTHTQTRESR
jgi:hypothetical protein